jgi:hypothetical protein
LHAIAHFLRSLVGERNGQNMHGVRAIGNEIRNALSKNASFARARASNHKQRAGWMQNCIALIWI